jgi:hypothetical protein
VQHASANRETIKEQQDTQAGVAYAQARDGVGMSRWRRGGRGDIGVYMRAAVIRKLEST